VVDRNGLADDVVAYAELAAELALGARPRAEVLAEHGLDEDAWAEIDERWQDGLSAALAGEGDELPPLVAAHAEAWARVQRALAGVPLSLDRFAEATVILQRGRDVGPALARLGVTLPAYLEATWYWARHATEEPSVEPELRAALARAAAAR
jgi:hypothetical protein